MCPVRSACCTTPRCQRRLVRVSGAATANLPKRTTSWLYTVRLLRSPGKTLLPVSRVAFSTPTPNGSSRSALAHPCNLCVTTRFKPELCPSLRMSCATPVSSCGRICHRTRPTLRGCTSLAPRWPPTRPPWYDLDGARTDHGPVHTHFVSDHAPFRPSIPHIV